jgi:hypothetical protein
MSDPDTTSPAPVHAGSNIIALNETVMAPPGVIDPVNDPDCWHAGEGLGSARSGLDCQVPLICPPADVAIVHWCRQTVPNDGAPGSVMPTTRFPLQLPVRSGYTGGALGLLLQPQNDKTAPAITAGRTLARISTIDSRHSPVLLAALLVCGTTRPHV